MDAITLIEIVVGIVGIIVLIGILLNLDDIARYLRMRAM